MTLVEELGLIDRKRHRFINDDKSLAISLINRVQNVHDRVDELVEFVASSDRINRVWLNEPPIEENLGRRISLAVTSNPHINELNLTTGQGMAMRDVLPWMTARGTLEHMTSLQKVSIYEPKLEPSGISVQDLDLILPLMLTSTSLQNFVVFLSPNHSHDAFMSAVSHYLSEATSLVSLGLYYGSLSQPAITSLCNGVRESSLRKLTLLCDISSEANREAAVECLAQAIAEFSLEEVTVERQMCLDLSNTMPVRSLDFAFSQIENDDGHYERLRLQINRKWKPLLSANVPLGLWPEILYTAHASPETSHGPEGILFFLLREKADLVFAYSI